MKRYIKSEKFVRFDNGTVIDLSKPIEDYTDEELEALPETVWCKSMYPCRNEWIYKLVRKEDLIHDPRHCFSYNSIYWGYAFPHDIYVCTDKDVIGRL